MCAGGRTAEYRKGDNSMKKSKILMLLMLLMSAMLVLTSCSSLIDSAKDVISNIFGKDDDDDGDDDDDDGDDGDDDDDDGDDDDDDGDDDEDDDEKDRKKSKDYLNRLLSEATEKYFNLPFDAPLEDSWVEYVAGLHTALEEATDEQLAACDLNQFHAMLDKFDSDIRIDRVKKQLDKIDPEAENVREQLDAFYAGEYKDLEELEQYAVKEKKYDLIYRYEQVLEAEERIDALESLSGSELDRQLAILRYITADMEKLMHTESIEKLLAAQERAEIEKVEEKIAELDAFSYEKLFESYSEVFSMDTRILTARSAYDDLPADLQAGVSNYETLLRAEDYSAAYKLEDKIANLSKYHSEEMLRSAYEEALLQYAVTPQSALKYVRNLKVLEDMASEYQNPTQPTDPVQEPTVPTDSDDPSPAELVETLGVTFDKGMLESGVSYCVHSISQEGGVWILTEYMAYANLGAAYDTALTNESAKEALRVSEGNLVESRNELEGRAKALLDSAKNGQFEFTIVLHVVDERDTSRILLTLSRDGKVSILD